MKFQAPINSKPMQALIDEARKVRCLEFDLREMLWLINAHPSLIGFDQIVENLHAMFQSRTFLELKGGRQSWTNKIDSWVRILEWMIKDREVLAANHHLKDIFMRAEQKEPRHPVSRLGITRHGFYACLWNRHESGRGVLSVTPSCLIYQRLQAQLCAAHMIALSTYSTMVEFEAYDQEREFCGRPIQAYPAATVLRELSLNKYESFLEKMPVQDVFLNYQQGLLELVHTRPAIHDLDADTVLDFFKKLSSYMLQIAEILKTGILPKHHLNSHRSGGAGGGKIRHGYVNVNNHVIRMKVEDDLGFEQGPEDALVLSLKEKEIDSERGGDSPTGSETPILLLYSAEEYGVAVGRAKYSERIQMLAAQRFPWNDNQLTDLEIKTLIAGLKNICDQYDQTSKPKVIDTSLCTAALLVWVMLNFGVDMESARNLRRRNAGTLLASEFALVQDKERNHIFWRIPGVCPEYRTDFDERYAKANRKIVRGFEVSDVTGLGARILIFMGKIARDDERVFAFEPKTAKKYAKEVTEKIGDPDRLTLGRIGRALESEVYGLSGDLTLAWCVCGNMRQRNQTRMFYTVYPVQRLRETYNKSIHRLYGMSSLAEAMNPSERNYIGARFVARFEVLREFVAKVRARLDKQVSLNQWVQTIEYHNAYTLYTWLIQAFCTAMRAVNDPAELIDQEEEADQSAYSLADKETVHESRARLVFPSSLLERQLEAYRLHRNLLTQAVGFQHKMERKAEQPIRLFHLDIQNDTPEVLTRSWLEDQFAKYGCPMPGNFHRAYLRSELLESGCSPQVIDAFMGHASKGESYFDHFSSFEYRQFRDTLKVFLDKVLAGMCLTPLPSRLVR